MIYHRPHLPSIPNRIVQDLTRECPSPLQLSISIIACGCIFAGAWDLADGILEFVPKMMKNKSSLVGRVTSMFFHGQRIIYRCFSVTF